MNKAPELKQCKVCGSFYCGPIRCRFEGTEFIAPARETFHHGPCACQPGEKCLQNERGYKCDQDNAPTEPCLLPDLADDLGATDDPAALIRFALCFIGFFLAAAVLYSVLR